MDHVQRSLINLHLTFILLGVTALFSHWIPLDFLDITLGRSIFACLLLATLVRYYRLGWRFERPRDMLWAVLFGLLMSGHWVTYFAALQYASVSVGIIAMFTFPIMVVFLEPLVDNTRLAINDVFSAIAVFIGVYLLVPEMSLANDITLGVVFGLGSAVLYAVRNTLHRKYFSQHSGVKSMAWQTAIIVLSLLPFTQTTLIETSWQNWLLLFVLGTAFTALPHALIVNALEYIKAKTFALMSCLQPLYAIVFAIILLDEQPTTRSLVGGLLIISAAVYESFVTHKEHQQAKSA